MKRRDLYPGPLIDGRRTHDHALGRLKRRIDSFLVTPHERDEAELERRLRAQAGVTRANLVVMASPKGGVGKTTTAFLAGNLLASHLKLRTIAVDAAPGFGTLGRLPNERARAALSLAELLEDADRLGTAAELRPYVSRLPSGLHVLAARTDALQPAGLGPTSYGELVALLSCFYEAVLLDVGTGVTGQLARFALARADQVALVTTPEELTANLVIHALDSLERPAAVVVNKAHPRAAAELLAIDECLALRGLPRSVPIPYDGRLARMLGSGTYSLEALDRRSRVAVKRLGLVVADRLV